MSNEESAAILFCFLLKKGLAQRAQRTQRENRNYFSECIFSVRSVSSVFSVPVHLCKYVDGRAFGKSGMIVGSSGQAVLAEIHHESFGDRCWGNACKDPGGRAKRET